MFARAPPLLKEHSLSSHLFYKTRWEYESVNCLRERRLRIKSSHPP
jgi:hypothetical protein